LVLVVDEEECVVGWVVYELGVGELEVVGVVWFIGYE